MWDVKFEMSSAAREVGLTVMFAKSDGARWQVAYEITLTHGLEAAVTALTPFGRLAESTGGPMEFHRLFRSRLWCGQFSRQAGGGGLGDKSAGVENFQRDGFMALGEMHDHSPELFGIVDWMLGHFHQQDVNPRIIPHV